MTDIDTLTDQLVEALADELAKLGEQHATISAERSKIMDELSTTLVEIEERQKDLAKRLKVLNPPVFPCPHCDRVFNSKQGVTMHNTMGHPDEVKASLTTTTDEPDDGPEPEPEVETDPLFNDAKGPTPELKIKMEGYWCNDCSPEVGYMRLATLGDHVRIVHGQELDKAERRKRKGTDID